MKPEIKKRVEMIRRGEVPPGYKKTKVGIIPEEWEEKKLKEIALINKESLKETTDDNYHFFYFDLSSVNNHRITLPEFKINYKDAPSRARRIFKNKDILMSTVRPNLKRFAHIDFEIDDCICSTGFAVITANSIEESSFIYNSLFTNNIDIQIKKSLVGSNYPAINNVDVENLAISYPTKLEDAGKIGLILVTWDKAIEKQEKLIELKKEQKNGLAYKLLTGKIRIKKYIKSKEYTKTKIGILPIDWNVEKSKALFNNNTERNIDGIEEVLAVTQGKGAIPRRLSEREIKYSEESVKNYKKVKKGDFIISLRSFEGGIEYSSYNGAVSPAYTVLRKTEIVHEHFYKYIFKSDIFVKRLSSSIIGIRDGKQVEYSSFKDMLFQCPPIEEQKAIAEILTTADKEIELLEKELYMIKEQKKGLMELLLTGIVRVK